MTEVPSSPSSSLSKSESQQSIIETPRAQKIKDEDSGTRAINQYQILRMLGEGSFAKVKLVQVIGSPDELYAMKIVKKEVKRKSLLPNKGKPQVFGNKQEESMNKEVAIMKKMNHPNLVRLHEVIDDEQQKKLYMILEYVKGGPCFVFGQDPLNEDQARKFFRDVLVGVSYMHKNNIVHHDIKPDNLLMDENRNVKLSDFGTTILYEDLNLKIKEVRGSPPFIPPEAVNSDVYIDGYLPTLADVYALGATLFMFIFGHPPYHEENKYDIYEKGTLEKDPDKRFTIKQIRQHSWVTCHETLPLPDELEKVEVTCEDIEQAVTKLISFHHAQNKTNQYVENCSRETATGQKLEFIVNIIRLRFAKSV
ncbi:MAG: putative Serine Threonine protein kinase [Streblomastix strix]|uniref:Putative Serine Threonine protein kinase n=1 Tax=Streblomastix strix TaxID=222440 RepID=A0A5J4VGW5_9EUKA|nr:MAG: putative Serine Threonine protein kinase [Streblomastix strix]